MSRDPANMLVDFGGGMERRLSAILLTDIVGYSRLTGLDEEGTIARQKVHHEEVLEPKISSLGGRIVKSTGDGLLVEFASVVDAVKCAVDVQKEMVNRDLDVPENRRIRYRIGINLGDVVIDGDDILGDGVNIVARLEELAAPGGVCVSGAVYDQLAGKLDIAFENAGEQTVKNVPRPVRVWRWRSGLEAKARTIPARHSKHFFLALAGFVLAIFVAGLGWWIFGKPENQRSREPQLISGYQKGKPVIAVLPFDNMSRIREQDYFSDGITQDLITELSRIKGLSVIARHSTFTYKGTKSTVNEIARELGASHVLEGSVRKSGSRLRINTTLVEARTGHQLWADRYDRQIRDIFELQDEVTRKIVSALSVELQLGEKDQLSRSHKVHPEAYDIFLRGLEKYHQFTSEGIVESRTYFKEAIVLDPNFARAHAALALTYYMVVQLGLTDDPKASTREALKIARHALALDETVREVHFVLANIHRIQGHLEKGIAAGRRAIALDPNYADAYAVLATNFNYSGSPLDASKTIKKAMQLNPRYPYFYEFILGHSLYLRRRYQEAAAKLERVRTKNPHFTLVHKMLAATYVALERLDEAEWAAAELLTLIPQFSLEGEAASSPYKDETVFNLFVDRLRKAGLK